MFSRVSCSFLLPRPPPISTLFPYTTLFRSWLVIWPNQKKVIANARNVLAGGERSEEHTSELQSLTNLVCRLLLEKKKQSRLNCKRLTRHHRSHEPTRNAP